MGRQVHHSRASSPITVINVIGFALPTPWKPACVLRVVVPDVGRSNHDLGLFDFAAVFPRTLLSLLCAVVATNDDLFAADLHLDSAVLDLPVTHRALRCRHRTSPLKCN